MSLLINAFSPASSRAATTPQGVPATQKPAALEGVGITEKLGAQVPVSELTFRDETGATVPFANFFKSGKPVLLSLAYYQCPTLCGFILNGMLEGVKGMNWVPGQQFEVVNVSIDAKEDHVLASSKKQSFLDALGKKDANPNFHFLTGTTENIQKLADSVGFGFKWNEAQREFAHGAGIFVLTPEGKLSRILYGIQYRPSDLKLSLLEASDGKVGTILDRIILFCYQYDPQLRQYSMAIFRVVRLAAAGMILFLVIYLGLFWFRQRASVKHSSTGGG